MSALSTSETRGYFAASTSTACLTTPITSSHSPSTVVNMEVVSFGSPDARTTRTASATAAATPSDSPPRGLTLNATSMRPPCPQPTGSFKRHEPALPAVRPHRPRRGALAGPDRRRDRDGRRDQRHACPADPAVRCGQRAQAARADVRALRGLGAAHVLEEGQPADAGDGRTPAAAPDQRDQHRRPAGGGGAGQADAPPDRPAHDARP